MDVKRRYPKIDMKIKDNLEKKQLRLKRNAFMVMPFDDSLAISIYENSTKPICEEFNLTLKRADEIFTVNPILEDIVKEIEQDTIVIVDISGKNPNVLYELGIAHALKKEKTIIITHDEFNSIPFDVSHIRILQYKDSIEGKTQYEKKLRKMLDSLFPSKGNMNKSQLIDDISSKTGLKKKDVKRMYDAFEVSVKGALKKGEKIALIGFGTFATRERAKRNGVNPRTGKKITIPAKTVPYFKVGKELKESVK